jgi:hypothetical protein
VITAGGIALILAAQAIRAAVASAIIVPLIWREMKRSRAKGVVR